jgi:pyridoxamine 5'-phosphate oxidase family protein
MSVFSPAEIGYLSSQRLGRLATVGPDGQPHVVPVAFRHNPERDSIDIGGHDFANRKKFRDVQHNPRVAFVVDDLASIRPWRVRGIEIRGQAEVVQGGSQLGPGFDEQMFRIRPSRIIAWGIEAEPNARSVAYGSPERARVDGSSLRPARQPWNGASDQCCSVSSARPTRGTGAQAPDARSAEPGSGARRALDP